MVTGTSVLGVKFTGGVVIAADMLGSYGSLARFRNISRLMKVMPPPAEVSWPTACFSNFNTGVSSTGEQQHHPGSLGRLRRLPTPETGHRADGVSACTHTRMCTLTYTHLYIPLPISLVSFSVSIDEELLGDGHSYSPKAVHSWLTRVMYNRRSRMNPLWNTVVIGGFYNGERWDSGWGGGWGQTSQAAFVFVTACFLVLGQFCFFNVLCFWCSWIRRFLKKKKEVYNSHDAFQHVYLLEVNLKWEVALLSPGCRLPSLQFPRLCG